jgi:hypothetical protein
LQENDMLIIVGNTGAKELAKELINEIASD